MSPELMLDLIGAAARGDEEAFGRLLLAHHRRLHDAIDRRLPRALRRYVTSEDIVADVFVEAWEKMSAVDAGQTAETFYGWLWKAAWHQMLDALKAERALKRGRHLIIERSPIAAFGEGAGELDALAVNAVTPSGVVSLKEALDAMEQAMAQLENAHYRQVIQLRFQQGLPVSEVAHLMDRSDGGVRLLTHRALRRLHELMGPASKYFSSGA